MKQSLSFITIGVRDLEKMKKFYIEQFGWTPQKDSEGIVFFKLNGLIFGLFPSHELAEDAGVADNGKGFKRFTLAVNYRSEKEVDEVFRELKQKGVKVIKEPEKVSWGGYRGYVSDIEDNYWEIAYNPFLELDENDNVVMHK